MTCILVVGTYDTKDDELRYLTGVITAQGGKALTMDVGVLGEPKSPVDLTKHDVAAAAGHTIAQIANAETENHAMQMMADGAAALALRLWQEGRFQGVIVLGGSMGTDLALDLTAALPVGVPKYIVSTVAFSPMIPPERLAPDIQMILWAGGLYGLNSICKASLSQAAGAVLGAARAVEPSRRDRPLIGMTSFGKTIHRYMVALKPALEARGFEVAVFHATGMGGRAFESLAAQGAFAAVLDFATQEVTNHLFGSAISAGPDRMTAAGLAGVPQIVAPGCYDLVDVVGWHPLPPALAGHDSHAHNRLLSSIMLTADERRQVARVMADKLATATGPTVLVLPEGGMNEWDREGGPLCDRDALRAFCTELRMHVPGQVRLVAGPWHINDSAFAETVLQVLDGWIADGTVRTAAPR